MKCGLLALTALIGLAATSSAAIAECLFIPVVFQVSQNQSVSGTIVTTKGSACATGFRTNGISTYSSGAIVLRPSHGQAIQTSMLNFVYRPPAGYKGADRFGVKVCGKDGAGTGCATITYDITVQ
jgi:hypothetical protein